MLLWFCRKTNNITQLYIKKSLSGSSRLATSRPLGEQSEPMLAIKRPIRREAVDRELRTRERSSRAIWNSTKDFFESLQQ